MFGMNSDEMVEAIRLAKRGDREQLGRLFASFQRYLILLAETQLSSALRCKVDAADVVQETFSSAHQAFERFQGDSPGQFLSWIRTILAAQLANTMRHYLGTQGRDIRLEQQIGQSIEQSSQAIQSLIVDPHSSPSQQVAAHEMAEHVASAVMRLPEDYRRVIVLRHLEGMTFPMIAKAMERSVDSVEKLWIRGVTKLRQEMPKDPSSHPA
jgi:RNA polymerase sigma-70 factor, ECF subfamily